MWNCNWTHPIISWKWWITWQKWFCKTPVIFCPSLKGLATISFKNLSFINPLCLEFQEHFNRVCADLILPENDPTFDPVKKAMPVVGRSLAGMNVHQSKQTELLTGWISNTKHKCLCLNFVPKFVAHQVFHSWLKATSRLVQTSMVLFSSMSWPTGQPHNQCQQMHCNISFFCCFMMGDTAFTAPVEI